MDEDIFKEKVGALSVKQLVRNAKDRRPGSMGFGEAMIIAYNGKKKSIEHRLSMNKLYAKELVFAEGETFGDDDAYDSFTIDVIDDYDDSDDVEEDDDTDEEFDGVTDDEE